MSLRSILVIHKILFILFRFETLILRVRFETLILRVRFETLPLKVWLLFSGFLSVLCVLCGK